MNVALCNSNHSTHFRVEQLETKDKTGNTTKLHAQVKAKQMECSNTSVN